MLTSRNEILESFRQTLLLTSSVWSIVDFSWCCQDFLNWLLHSQNTGNPELQSGTLAVLRRNGWMRQKDHKCEKKRWKCSTMEPETALIHKLNLQILHGKGILRGNGNIACVASSSERAEIMTQDAKLQGQMRRCCLQFFRSRSSVLKAKTVRKSQQGAARYILFRVSVILRWVKEA